MKNIQKRNNSRYISIIFAPKFIFVKPYRIGLGRLAMFFKSIPYVDIITNISYDKIMDINIPFIDKIIPIIISIASPDQIILFGSYARGDNTEIGYVYKTIKEQGKVIYG